MGSLDNLIIRQISYIFWMRRPQQLNLDNENEILYLGNTNELFKNDAEGAEM